MTDLSLKLSTPGQLVARVLPYLPGSIAGAGGLVVTVSGGVYTVAPQSGSVVSITTGNTWTALQTFNAGVAITNNLTTDSLTISGIPTYNLASNTLAVPLLIPLNAAAQTVPAADTFSFVRGSQTNGTDGLFTVGAGGVATGPYFSLTSQSGSNASSNVYGGVLHATNAGPGTVRGAHLAGIAISGSTGATSAAALEITPVSTSSGAWGAFASLVSSGVNGKAVGYGIETQGDTYAIGFGSTVNPVGYTNAAYRAWMATASGASARAFSTLQNDGTEIQYIKKTGEVVSTSLIAGTQGSFETNGIAIGAATINRTAAAGSMNISAGSNAGNVIQFATASTTRLQLSDNGAQITGALATTGPVTLTGSSGTVTGPQGSVIINATTTFSVTLPSAATFSGQWIHIKAVGTTTTVTSASSNVVPIGTTTAGTALLSAAGKFANLQSDGSNWVIMAAN